MSYNKCARENPRSCWHRAGGNHSQAVSPECGLRNPILAKPPQPRKAVSVNVLSRERQLTVLQMLVEGVSLRSIARITGVHRTTTIKLLVEVGRRCRTFLDGRMRGLKLDHLQVDEIWTFVLKKQGHLREHEQADPTIGDQYLFVALDQETKLVPSFVLGKRTQENARMLMEDLSERVELPGALAPVDTPRLQISTDGFVVYPQAVNEAFGPHVHFGTIVKNYQEIDQPGRYAPPEISGTTRTVISGNFSPRSICTSHVERHNLSIRTFLRRFTRLALGFSKKLENLAAAVSLYLAYYNYCWLHGSLNGTPAMEAGIAGHPWTMAELLDAV